MNFFERLIWITNGPLAHTINFILRVPGSSSGGNLSYAWLKKVRLRRAEERGDLRWRPLRFWLVKAMFKRRAWSEIFRQKATQSEVEALYFQMQVVNKHLNVVCVGFLYINSYIMLKYNHIMTLSVEMLKIHDIYIYKNYVSIYVHLAYKSSRFSAWSFTLLFLNLCSSPLPFKTRIIC